MPVTPSTDNLRFKAMGAGVRDRYAAARAEAERARAAALDALAGQAELTGIADVLPNTNSALIGRADQADARLGGDTQLWNNWWDLIPGVDYARLAGLGGAGQAAWLDAKKKRGSGRKTGGGSGYSNAPSWEDAWEEAVRGAAGFASGFTGFTPTAPPGYKPKPKPPPRMPTRYS